MKLFHCLHGCACCFAKCCNSLQSFLLLALRLIWGYLFFVTGLLKLSEASATAEFFKSLGIVWPHFSAYLVGVVECVGGILILLGLCARFASVPLLIIMGAALATAHRVALLSGLSQPLELLTQPPMTFVIVLLVILCFGPGLFSLDALIKRRCGCKICCSEGSCSRCGCKTDSKEHEDKCCRH